MRSLPLFICAVGLPLDYRTLCAERKDVKPNRMVHTDRHLFVGDWKSHSILVYSLERNWQFIRQIGSKGKGAGQFDWPMGMCVYRDRLIVCDYDNNRLQFVNISAADAKDWAFDPPFGSEAKGKGQFNRPADVCVASGVLFVAEEYGHRVQTFTITVNAVNGSLALTPRSIVQPIGSPFFGPYAIVSSAGGERVFVGDMNRIYSIDVKSDAVRPFADVPNVYGMHLRDGLLYVTHSGCLSIIDAVSGAARSSSLTQFAGRAWSSAWGVVALPEFLCIASASAVENCVHLIPRK